MKLSAWVATCQVLRRHRWLASDSVVGSTGGGQVHCHRSFNGTLLSEGNKTYDKIRCRPSALSLKLSKTCLGNMSAVNIRCRESKWGSLRRTLTLGREESRTREPQVERGCARAWESCISECVTHSPCLRNRSPWVTIKGT